MPPLLIIGVPLALLALVALGGSTPSSRRKPRRRRAAEPLPSDAAEERLSDVELLRRYGTEADAERLTAMGYGDELRGLGYRPPGD